MLVIVGLIVDVDRGFVLKISVLWSIGMILLVIGGVLWILGSLGHAVGGRRHYY